MSAEHPNVVYVGEADQGRAFASTVEARDWPVYVADDAMEALGMVVVYLPDLVVIDLVNRPVLGTETFYHLRSMTGEPVPTLLLVEEEDSAKPAPYTWVELLPANQGNPGVIRAIEAMMGVGITA